MWCNVGFAEEKKKLPEYNKDYGWNMNDSIVNYGWKIKSLTKTSKHHIYVLSKDKWIMYCTIQIDILRSRCSIP